MFKLGLIILKTQPTTPSTEENKVSNTEAAIVAMQRFVLYLIGLDSYQKI
jgi:hypothetical protein